MVEEWRESRCLFLWWNSPKKNISYTSFLPYDSACSGKFDVYYYMSAIRQPQIPFRFLIVAMMRVQTGSLMSYGRLLSQELKTAPFPEFFWDVYTSVYQVCVPMCSLLPLVLLVAPLHATSLLEECILQHTDWNDIPWKFHRWCMISFHDLVEFGLQIVFSIPSLLLVTCTLIFQWFEDPAS